MTDNIDLFKRVLLDEPREQIGKGYPEYRDDQARGDDGRWSGGGGGGTAAGAARAKQPGGGRKPREQQSIKYLTRLFRQAKAERTKVRSQITRTQARINSLPKGKSKERARAQLKALKERRTELTREMGKLLNAVARRNPKGGMGGLLSGGLPVPLGRSPRRLKRRTLKREVAELLEKGYPEYDDDQPRGDDGRWTAGSGTSARTARRRRQQERERAAAQAKKPRRKKPATTTGKPKPKTKPAPKPQPKRPKPKPKQPEAEKPKPKAPRKPRAQVPAVVDRPDPPAVQDVPELKPVLPDRMTERDHARLDQLYGHYDRLSSEYDQAQTAADEAFEVRERAYSEARYSSGGERESRYLDAQYDRAEANYQAVQARANRLAERRDQMRGAIEDLETRLRRGGSQKRAALAKRTSPLYGCRPVVNAKAIIAWAKDQGFETTLEPDDMHVTFAYSNKPVAWPKPRHSYIKVPAGERSIEQFDKGATVLRFDSNLLTDRWDAIRDAGASWEHHGFKPHVTLSYRVPPDLDLSSIEPYNGPIILGPERFEEIKEDIEHVEKLREIKAAVSKALTFTKALELCAERQPEYACTLFKADEGLGLVFGWAIVSSEDGEPYYDTQGDHIPEDAMLNAAADFMLRRRSMKIMHSGKKVGDVVFAWPMTEDIAEAMGIEGKRTGLMIAVKPDNPNVLERFRNGQYTGFSIGGNRLIDEEVEDDG